MTYKVHIANRVNNAIGKVYNGYILSIEQLDLVSMQRKTLFQITFFEMMICALLFKLKLWQLIDFYTERRLRSSYSCNENGREYIYRAHVYGYPHAFLFKNYFEIPYDIESSIIIHKHQSRKYLLLLVNGNDDITACYRKHCDSIDESNNITANELICLACIDRKSADTYMNYLEDMDTYLVAIDDNTLEERIFKKTEIVVL